MTDPKAPSPEASSWPWPRIDGPPDPTWILRYDDQDVPDEVFGGAGAEEAARATFEARRQAWSCSLFVEVARG